MAKGILIAAMDFSDVAEEGDPASPSGRGRKGVGAPIIFFFYDALSRIGNAF